MQNYRGFLSWLFQGWYRDCTIWGMIISGMAFLNMLVDGSLVATWLLLSLGLALVLFDLVYRFLSFQYSLYRMERDRVSRELERK
jgi:hypothetical protein